MGLLGDAFVASASVPGQIDQKETARAASAPATTAHRRRTRTDAVSQRGAPRARRPIER